MGGGVYYHVVVHFSLLYDEIEELGNGLSLVSLDSSIETLPGLEIPLGFHHELTSMKLSYRVQISSTVVEKKHIPANLPQVRNLKE